MWNLLHSFWVLLNDAFCRKRFLCMCLHLLSTPFPHQSVRHSFRAQVRTNHLSESIYLPIIIVIILISISDNRSLFNTLLTMTRSDLSGVPIIQFSAYVICTHSLHHASIVTCNICKRISLLSILIHVLVGNSIYSGAPWITQWIFAMSVCNTNGHTFARANTFKFTINGSVCALLFSVYMKEKIRGKIKKQMPK